MVSVSGVEQLNKQKWLCSNAIYKNRQQAGSGLHTVVCQLLVWVTVDMQMYREIFNIRAGGLCFIEISEVTEPKDEAEVILKQ